MQSGCKDNKNPQIPNTKFDIKTLFFGKKDG